MKSGNWLRSMDFCEEIIQKVEERFKEKPFVCKVPAPKKYPPIEGVEFLSFEDFLKEENKND